MGRRRSRRVPPDGFPVGRAQSEVLERGFTYVPSIGHASDLLDAMRETDETEHEYDVSVVKDPDTGEPVTLKVTDKGPREPKGAPEGASPSLRRRAEA